MNQKLQDYIKQSRIAGLSDDQIKQKLLEANWSESDINESFNNNFDTNAKSPDSNRIRVDYNIKKSKKGLYIIIGIIVVILIIGSISYYFVYQRDITENVNVIDDKYSESLENGGKYKNNLLNYEIEYGSSWRIATDLSKELAILNKATMFSIKTGCLIDYGLEDTYDDTGWDKAIEDYNKCLVNHSDYDALEEDFNKFQEEWTIYNSDIVAITTVDKKSELEFLKNAEENRDISIINFPEPTIKIYPSFIDTYPSKEGGTDTMQIKYYKPIDGNKAYIIDHKDSGYGRSLAVYILHELDYYIEIEEKMAKSLEIQTDMDEGSDLEQDFYKIVNSLHFIE